MNIRRILAFAIAAATLCSLTAFSLGAESPDPLVANSAALIRIDDGRAILAAPIGASELAINFHDAKNVTITDIDGNELTLTDKVGSGAVITHANDAGSALTTVLYGDVNGDGAINTRDIALTMSSIVGGADVFAPAADVTRDGRLNAKDVATMMQYAAGWEVTLAPAAEREKAEHEDESVTMYFDSIMHNVAREDTAVYGDEDGFIKMAKNEREDVQIVLAASEKKEWLTLEVGTLTSDSGATLTHELRYGYYYDGVMFNQLKGKDYYNYTDGYYVDPLPLLCEPFGIGENESRMFCVTVDTTAQSEPGMYSAPVILRDADGGEIKRATLRVYVWDFALDVTPASGSAFGMNYDGILIKHFNGDYDAWNNADRAETDAVKVEWYEYLLKNKLNAQDLPCSFTSQVARNYMADPRVTGFAVYHGDYTNVDNNDLDEIVRIYTQDLAGMEEYFDKAYIYDVDEPWRDIQFDFLKRQWNYLKETIPDVDFHVLVPLAGNNYNTMAKYDFVSLLDGVIDWWCPQSYGFTKYATYQMKKDDPEKYPPYGNYWSNPQSLKTFEEFPERAKKFKERGDKMWWYICESPEFPYANFFRSYQGVDVRMVLWQQYMNDVDGILYWGTTVWVTSLEKNRPVTLTQTNQSGDGLLLYWGELFGQTGPVPTQRLEDIRDGIEDFQYLTQLENLTDRETSMKYVDRITQGMLTFTEDYHDIISVRDELGFYLESFEN